MVGTKQAQPATTITRKRPRDSELEEIAKRGCSTGFDQPMVKMSSRSSEQEEEHSREVSLEDLSPHFFCNVLSCLGPTSQSLISLSMVNKHFRKTMMTVGNAMLPRAQSHFRRPLKAKSVTESSMSLFIRHTRICSKILRDLTTLRENICKSPETIQSDDVDGALDMALDLLEVGPALSITLERKVLATAGKCGGKVFKYSKWMLGHSRTTASKDFQKRLETSRLIMQTVVCREVQLSQQSPASINSFVQKQVGTRQCQPTGCF